VRENQIVRLLPNSKRLKQVIKEHGNRFRILAPPAPLQCFGNNTGVQAESVKTKHFRNILIEDVTEE
jgi:hypothetical protein